MKYQKLFIIAVAVFLSGSAQAQLQGIVDEYCEEAEQNVDRTTEELNEASTDLGECSSSFDSCINNDDDLFVKASKCIRDYARCIRPGKRDQSDACKDFLRELQDDTRTAERNADQEGVRDDWNAWIYGQPSTVVDPTREQCFTDEGVYALADVCQDQQVGD